MTQDITGIQEYEFIKLSDIFTNDSRMKKILIRGEKITGDLSFAQRSLMNRDQYREIFKILFRFFLLVFCFFIFFENSRTFPELTRNSFNLESPSMCRLAFPVLWSFFDTVDLFFRQLSGNSVGKTCMNSRNTQWFTIGSQTVLTTCFEGPGNKWTLKTSDSGTTSKQMIGVKEASIIIYSKLADLQLPAQSPIHLHWRKGPPGESFWGSKIAITNLKICQQNAVWL